jgi:hypothetical protein
MPRVTVPDLSLSSAEMPLSELDLWTWIAFLNLVGLDPITRLAVQPLVLDHLLGS